MSTPRVRRHRNARGKIGQEAVEAGRNRVQGKIGQPALGMIKSLTD